MITRIPLLAVFFACGLVTGIAFVFVQAPSGKPLPPPEVCGASYPLINKWLRCEPDQNIQQKKEFTKLRAELVQEIDQWKKEGKVSAVSVYVRDLEFGPWTGIAERDAFAPASIMKLPILFTILRLVEKKPETLHEALTIEQDFGSNVQSLVSTTENIRIGETYTVEELLRRMVVHSDNSSLNALVAYLMQLAPNENLVYTTLENIGIASEGVGWSGELNTKQAASFFRILYNASYLNKDLSQYALALLTQTTFHDGIVAGVEEDIPIAHKFGERGFGESGDKQLHDCGIVYYPPTHYLLCIMTRGESIEQNMEIIREISKRVHEEMQSRASPSSPN